MDYVTCLQILVSIRVQSAGHEGDGNHTSKANICKHLYVVSFTCYSSGKCAFITAYS